MLPVADVDEEEEDGDDDSNGSKEADTQVEDKVHCLKFQRYVGTVPWRITTLEEIDKLLLLLLLLLICIIIFY